MLLELQDSQLVLVDYQSQLMPVMHEGEAVLRNGVRLAQMAHLLKVPTWGTEQKPRATGPQPRRDQRGVSTDPGEDVIWCV